MLASGIWGYGLGLVNLSLPCYAIVMSGMSGYLDGLNFDSDEDFEETAGRGSARPEDRQHDEAGGGVAVGRGLGRGSLFSDQLVFSLDLQNIII